MNISDLNKKIYGHKDLKEGEYANFMMGAIEQQQGVINNLNEQNIDNKFGKINKEIKF